MAVGETFTLNPEVDRVWNATNASARIAFGEFWQIINELYSAKTPKKLKIWRDIDLWEGAAGGGDVRDSAPFEMGRKSKIRL